jgi:hypothetical protein
MRPRADGNSVLDDRPVSMYNDKDRQSGHFRKGNSFMLKTIYVFAALILFFFTVSHAEKASSLQEAEQLSAQTGKPILMEFVHQD